MQKYDVIIQNNGSKETFLLSGLTDTSENHLYHRFEAEISAPEGEYTYAVLQNSRDDVNYAFKVPLLDTIVYADGQQVVLRYLQPATGLLRVGKKVEPANIYDNAAPESGQTQNNDDNTIFYYE